MKLSDLQDAVKAEIKRRKIKRTVTATYNVALQILKSAS